MMMKKYLFLFSLAVFIFACNKDDIIEEEHQKPEIILDNETGVYSVKVGRELIIAPTYQYADDATFSWTVEGEVISSEPSLVYSWSEPGDVYVTLQVANKAGSTQEELKVEVLELQLPYISVLIPPKGLKAQKGCDFIITPIIENRNLDNFKIEWIRDGAVVSTDTTYIFNESSLGVYPITIKTSNEDGDDQKDFEVEVVEFLYTVEFPPISMWNPSTDRTAVIGRPLFLKPNISGYENPQFKWFKDGVLIEDANEQTYKFVPDALGEFIFTVTVTEELDGISVSADVKVTVYDEP